MIYGIDGWQRSGKDIISAMIAAFDIPAEMKARYDRLHLPGMVEEVRIGYGNVTLYNMPYEWVKLESTALLEKMLEVYRNGEKGVVFLFSEAHRSLNPRLWDKRTKQETEDMAGLMQDDKLGSHLIYNYHPGHKGVKEDELLGVDKTIRGATGKEISITSRESSIWRRDLIKFDYTDWTNGKPTRHKKLRNVSQFFKLFNTLEPVK